MENQKEINVLIQVAVLAQSKGILTLEEASIVLNCIKQLEEKKEDEQGAI